MGACFNYKDYKILYFKSKNCPDCKKRGVHHSTKIEDGKRVCGTSSPCNWSERAMRSKLTVAEAQIKWDNDVSDSQWSSGNEYSGEIGMLEGNVNWVKNFSTKEGAIEYIENNHEKWDEPMGAKYLKARGSSNRLTKQLCGFIIGGWCSS